MGRRLLNKLDIAIFGAVAVLLLSLIAILVSSLLFQYSNYRDGIEIASADHQYVDHASILTYSRAWDFAVAKTSALFLSFLLIFTGALYVLRTAESRVELEATKGEFKGHLSMSSPGLFMVTLGVFLVAFVISSKTMVEYSWDGGRQPNLESRKSDNVLLDPSSPIVEQVDKE
ncbi:hypothetical protein [Halomonas sp. BN3-1]|uniref:hypothetical protein n=1 Tax=unclassified Halomonas TaxID=2609666 RepID=UPI000D3939F6|nr:hypothetical protein [Halomonas sp. BN3-1]